MKKGKLISMALAMILLLSMCSFGVSAADAVTAESLANGQLTDCIVSNLALPEGYAWTSSNTDVIANDGKVTRPITQDETVTMTGAKEGSDALSFAFTVKARTTKVIDQYSFYDPDKLNQAGNLSVGKWTNSGAAQDTPIQQETNGNYYLAQDYSTYNTVTTYTPAEPLTGKFTIGFDFQHAAVDPGLNVRVDYVGTPKNGAGEAKQVAGRNILGFATNTVRYYYNNSTLQAIGSPKSDQWNKLSLSFDMDQLSYDCSLNPPVFKKTDIKLPLLDVENYSDYNWSITKIVIRRAGSTSAGGTFQMDNFKICADNALSDILGEMTDDEVAGLCSEAITQDKLTTESAAAIRKNLTLPTLDQAYESRKVGLSWSSANPGISNTGVVTPAALPQTGAVTATITAGEVTLTKTFEFTVAPAGTKEFRDGYLSRDFENTSATPAEDKIGVPSAIAAEYAANVGGRSGKALKATLSSAGNNICVNTWSEIVYYGITTGHYLISSDLRLDLTGVEKPGRYYFQVEGNGVSAAAVFDFSGAKPTLSLARGSYGAYASYAMPQKIKDGDWFHIDINMNVISRSYDVFIDGVKLNPIPSAMNNAYDGRDRKPGKIGSAPMRKISLRFDAPGTMYMDNVSVSEFTDADQSMAEAAVNAALITFAGYTLQELPLTNKVASSLVLPAAGPNDGKVYSETATEDNPVMYSFSGGATLSYTANGAVVSGTYAPQAAGTTEFTVTAEKNGKSASGSFTRKTAPVVVDSVTYDEDKTTVQSIALSGRLQGKVIIAAYDQEGNILKETKVYDAAASIEANYSIPQDCYIRVYVMDVSSVKPLSFAQ